MSGSISTTRPAWFLRGLMVGVLASAALNSLSYFARSDGWGNLLGVAPMHREAIGFPVEMWEEGNGYGGLFVDYPALLLNVAVGLAAGVLLGLLAMAMRPRLNQLVEDLERQFGDSPPHRSFQFSMRGLLLSTALVAVVATGMRHWLAGQPEVLGAIYVLGPWLLVGLALLPRRIPWEQRVALLVPMTIGLILLAVAVGGTLATPRNLEQVLMGVFVCWTPQTALAALGMTAALLFSHRASLLRPAGESA